MIRSSMKEIIILKDSDASLEREQLEDLIDISKAHWLYSELYIYKIRNDLFLSEIELEANRDISLIRSYKRDELEFRPSVLYQEDQLGY